MKTILISGSGAGGLPEHFPHSSVRQLQKAAIEAIAGSWKDGFSYVFLEAPTGFGKSAIAITLAKQNPPAFILVSTKTLQDQYVREKAYDTMQVKGRGNFVCMLAKDRTCDVGPCHLGSECRHRPERIAESSSADLEDVSAKRGGNEKIVIRKGMRVCHYWKQKCEGMNHDYPVMNYSYFLHETMHAKDFGKRKLMVCDEAHNMEDELMRFIEFSISDKDLELVNCKIPEKDLPVEEWAENLKDWNTNLFEEFKNSREASERTRDVMKRMELLKKMQSLEEKFIKCVFIAKELSADPENWLIDRSVTGKVKKVTFKPIFVKRWGKRFSGMADLFLFQSATIIDAKALADSLGLEEDKCVFLRAGSEFLPESRPVYYKPIGSMSKAGIEDTLPKLAAEIRKLIAKYPDKKGVIHTHTYKIQDYIMNNISSSRFIANRSDETRMRGKIMEEFMKSDKPLILVTPSAYEGMDFRDDICRWQVICKMPYPDMGDPQVRKRMELSGSWYQWKTVLRLVQTYGRGTRNKNDWCDTYIFDSSFSHLMNSAKGMFPEWFTEAVVRI
jgi:Rad3-related DNA helicase